MAEGSMALFDGIDVNPEKLAQAPPVVQRPSFISRTMGIGSRSSLEEAQTLMRQLSSRKHLTDSGGRNGVLTNRSPSIQELPRQRSSFLSSILPTGISSLLGGTSTRNTKYRDGPQDPSVLIDRRGLQPADSIEDSSLHELEQGQGQVHHVNVAAVAPEPQPDPSTRGATSGTYSDRERSPVVPMMPLDDVIVNNSHSAPGYSGNSFESGSFDSVRDVRSPKAPSMAMIVPVDSMDSIEGVLRGGKDVFEVSPTRAQRQQHRRSRDQFEDGSASATNSGTGSMNAGKGAVAVEGTDSDDHFNHLGSSSTKKFLLKQGTFANICIEEEEDWMRDPNNQLNGSQDGGLIGEGLVMGGAGSVSGVGNGVISHPVLPFDYVNGLRRNSNILTQANTTNDNSSRDSSTRTISMVRQYHQPNDGNGDYGNDNSEGSITSVVQLQGQLNGNNNDDIEYDRRQQQLADLSASSVSSNSTNTMNGRRSSGSSMLMMSMMTPLMSTNAPPSTLDAVPEAPGDGSRSMLEEQSSLISNDPRLHHLLVTQDIENM